MSEACLGPDVQYLWMGDQRDWLVWDGECGFCYNAVVRLKKRDYEKRFQVSAFQNTPHPPMTDALRVRAASELLVIRPTGEVLGGARAVLFVLEKTGWGWFARFLRWPPMIWAIELGYRLIANNRISISKVLYGRQTCGLEYRYPEPED